MLSKFSIRILLVLFVFAFVSLGLAQKYEDGDIVENFTLTDRATNQPVSLYEMEGKIIFLEWFAYWCPFCQAAAADIGPGIVDYYNNIGGNPNDIEVMHVGLNLQGNQEFQTQNFINTYGLGLVLNDFGRAVANRFQSSAQPIFAIINGVAGSSSHQQWELLYTELGYGDLSAPIQTFRSVIDSVGAATGEAPLISVQPSSQKVETGRGFNLFATVVSESPVTYQWKFDHTDIEGATNSELAIENTQTDHAGQYTVAVSNVNGTTISEAATIEVVLGFIDSLAAQGVPIDQRGLSDDPDHDGIINAYEFLSRTDANDSSSGEPPRVSTALVENATYLILSFRADPSIRSIVPQVQFSVSPAFNTGFLTPLLEEEINEGQLIQFKYRASASLEVATQFARLQLSVE